MLQAKTLKEAASDSVMKERTKPRNIQTYIKLICIAAEMPHISPEVIVSVFEGENPHTGNAKEDCTLS